MTTDHTTTPAITTPGLCVVEFRAGGFVAWYGGLCGHAADCPLVAAARCLAHAARNAGAFGWFVDIPDDLHSA